MKSRAFLVVDLGFGDSGKGTTVEYLAWRNNAKWIVRFNGGPQVGHNVVLRDGRHHRFAQFGSGSFEPGVQTLLSRFVAIEPYAMLNEAAPLEQVGVPDVLSRTSIDERCLVITPPQQIANRLRERARRELAHGTCGIGFGECVGDSMAKPENVLRAIDLRNPELVRQKLRRMLEWKREEVSSWKSLATAGELQVMEDSNWIATAVQVYSQVARECRLVGEEDVKNILRESNCTVFEGAQGVLLDERYGFHPHTTWSKTTFTNANLLLDESGAECERERIGVIRPYLTRHGNGPFVTEDRYLDQIPELHNTDDGWPGRFRRGLLDLVILRYAINVCGGVNALAVTCLDQLKYLPPVACVGYEIGGGEELIPTMSDELREMQSLTERLMLAKPRYDKWPTDSAEAFCGQLERSLGVPVAYVSFGATREDKRTAGVSGAGNSGRSSVTAPTAVGASEPT